MAIGEEAFAAPTATGYPQGITRGRGRNSAGEMLQLILSESEGASDVRKQNMPMTNKAPATLS